MSHEVMDKMTTLNTLITPMQTRDRGETVNVAEMRKYPIQLDWNEELDISVDPDAMPNTTVDRHGVPLCQETLGR